MEACASAAARVWSSEPLKRRRKRLSSRTSRQHRQKAGVRSNDKMNLCIVLESGSWHYRRPISSTKNRNYVLSHYLSRLENTVTVQLIFSVDSGIV